jgi:membrane protein YqaA with SNARE-associated domain
VSNPAAPGPRAALRASWLPEPPLWLGAVWGFAEATVFFVVPDLVITLVALSSLRRAARHLVVVTCGSVAGGILMYTLAAHQPATLQAVVDGVPFVRQWMFDSVARDYAAYGVWGVCMGPLAGIPYKVYAVLGPAHASPAAFALVSVPARMERLATTLVVFAAAGWALRRWFPGRTSLALGFYLAYWLVVYGYYWTWF